MSAGAAACGGAAPPAPAAKLADVTLTYMDRGGQPYAELHAARAQAMMDAHPGLKISGEQTSDMAAKVPALAAAGAAPDVLVHVDHTQVVQFAALGGMLAPLDAYIARDRQLNLQDLQPEVQAQYRFDRKVYGVAHGVSLGTLFVNLDLFAAAGVPPPPTDYKDARWTFAAFADAAKRLTKLNGRGGFDQAGAIVENVSLNGNAGGWILANGGAFLDDLEAPKRVLLDSPAAREVLQFLTDLRLKLQVWPVGDQLEGLTTDQWFQRGRAAMWINGSFKVNAIRSALQAAWDVAALPHFKGQVVRLNGSGVSLTAGGRQPDAAWEFLRHMVDGEYQRQQTAAGLDTPARTSVITGPEFLAQPAPPKSRKVFGDSIQYGKALNVRSRNGPEVEAAFNTNLTALLGGTMSLGDMITQTTGAVGALLAAG